jgi:hypothetical protein
MNKQIEIHGKIDLWEIIKWKFRKKKYIGSYTYYLGKTRKIVAEDFETVRLENINNPVAKTAINLLYESNRK